MEARGGGVGAPGAADTGAMLPDGGDRRRADWTSPPGRRWPRSSGRMGGRYRRLALRGARARQRAPDFAARYAARAGVEGTIAQGVRTCDLRHARYRGLAKTRLQHLLAAAAMNVARLAARFAERPRAATRPSRLAALAA